MVYLLLRNLKRLLLNESGYLRWDFMIILAIIIGIAVLVKFHYASLYDG